MISVNAVSLAPDARDWLANSRHPRILHVFDRACNLINERREILSIVTQQIGNGAFNLVVEDDVLFSEHLNLPAKSSNLCFPQSTQPRGFDHQYRQRETLVSHAPIGKCCTPGEMKFSIN